MNQIQITLRIDAAEAIRQGRTFCGETSMAITPEVLAALTEEERDTLSRHLAGEEHYREKLDRDIVNCKVVAVGVANTETLSKLLKMRREHVAQKALEERDAMLVRLRSSDFSFWDSQLATLENEGDQEMRDAVAAYRVAAREYKQAEARKREERKALEEQAKREQQAKDQAVRDRAAHLKASVPSALLERWEADYASEKEFRAALWEVVLAELGLSGWEPADTRAASRLPDEEFAQFARWQAKLPSNIETWAAVDNDDLQGSKVFAVVYLNEPAVYYAVHGTLIDADHGEFRHPLETL